jgi:hypothetical protein
MDIMTNSSRELEVEIFDPTGHGIEVVDAEYARKLWKDCEDAKNQTAGAEHALLCAKAEISSLQQQLKEIEAIAAEERHAHYSEDNGSTAGIVKLMSAELSKFRELAHAESNKGDFGNTSASKGSDEISLIDKEVAEFCDHPDCTTLDAVLLMKCRLQELQSEATRQKIYRRWRG